MKNETNVACRRCGKQARQYVERGPLKGTRPLGVLVLAVAVLFFWCFSLWFLTQPDTDSQTVATTVMAGVIFTTGAVVVAVSMVAPKQAHVIRCPKCGALSVVEDAPQNSGGWDLEKYRKRHPNP